MTKEEALRLLKTQRIDGDDLHEAFDMALKALEEHKTGKWIEKDGWDGDVYYDCSVCGESWTTIEGTPWDNDMNYCPHCGAKMERAEKGADDGTC